MTVYHRQTPFRIAVCALDSGNDRETPKVEIAPRAKSAEQGHVSSLALSYSCPCQTVKKRICQSLVLHGQRRLLLQLSTISREEIAMEEIRIVDTTLRDGNTSLWAHNMTTGMMHPVLSQMDQAGFDAMEFFVSGRFKKVVREQRDNPWDWVRYGQK